jgi:hypothetical protein
MDILVVRPSRLHNAGETPAPQCLAAPILQTDKAQRKLTESWLLEPDESGHYKRVGTDGRHYTKV